jgi:hypothetical protein
MDILSSWAHMLELPHGRNWTEHRPNGTEGKEVQVDDTGASKLFSGTGWHHLL